MKSTVALFLAIVLAVVAVVGVNRYIRQQKAEATKGLELVPVIVAKKRIKTGTVITRAMLSTKLVAERYMHVESIVPTDIRRLVGQAVRRNVDRGTELLWSYFEVPDEGSGRELLSGERAVTMPVDVVRGVAGLIVPNSRIDIYGTFAFPMAGGQGATERRTVLLLSDVLVLAIDNVTQSRRVQSLGREREKQGYSSLTLAVSPTEAALMIFAQGQGDLHLTLRHSADVGAVTEKISVDFSNMLELAEQANQKRAKRHDLEDNLAPNPE